MVFGATENFNTKLLSDYVGYENHDEKNYSLNLEFLNIIMDKVKNDETNEKYQNKWSNYKGYQRFRSFPNKLVQNYGKHFVKRKTSLISIYKKR